MITISKDLMEQKIEKISSNMHKIKEKLTPDTPPIKNGYRPITLGFITTPELSVQRKGQPGRAVNVENLSAYNRILLSAQNEIEKNSFTNSLTRTDTYQGRLEEFILDISSKLTDEIINSLEIGKNKQVKSVKESIGEAR